jgi:hypothetical protein
MWVDAIRDHRHRRSQGWVWQNDGAGALGGPRKRGERDFEETVAVVAISGAHDADRKAELSHASMRMGLSNDQGNLSPTKNPQRCELRSPEDRPMACDTLTASAD